MKSESQNVEYKQSWHDEYLRWVCGFANAKGGTIWIGIDDKKKVVGIEGAKKLMEDIPNKIKDTMGIVVDVSLVKRQKQDLLKISIPESDFPVAYHGEYHYRTGSTKQQLTGFALTQFLFHKMHLSWDGAETAGRLDFKKYRFKQFKLRYEKKTGREFKDSWFVSTGFKTKGGVLTNAGALFADECPIPQSRLFCTVWNGLTKSDDSANDREFSGNLIELLDAAEKWCDIFRITDQEILTMRYMTAAEAAKLKARKGCKTRFETALKGARELMCYLYWLGEDDGRRGVRNEE